MTAPLRAMSRVQRDAERYAALTTINQMAAGESVVLTLNSAIALTEVRQHLYRRNTEGQQYYTRRYGNTLCVYRAK